MSLATHRLAIAAAVSLLLLGLSAPAPASQRAKNKRVAKDIPARAARADIAAGDAATLAEFEGRVKAYARLRERLEDQLPKLPKDATAEQIEAHKTSFQEVVRDARAGARHGDIFTPRASAAIRRIIAGEFRGQSRQQIREKVSDAETEGVVMRVNHPYPDSQELVDIPPTLLLKLPQLPKQVKYRFVGHSLLLVDRENGLIVDFMPEALP
ncbi:MAG TPA: hypothetical protein VEY09_07995 [Pyrinomonadaceae bacterium]|nr:hypothetical protein [Pyrinomonadaceae bacterium]